MTFWARMNTRRACWTITLVAWALRTLCPRHERLNLARWAAEFAKNEAFYLENPGYLLARDQGCELPLPGWYCSREPGHDGPCAARRSI